MIFKAYFHYFCSIFNAYFAHFGAYFGLFRCIYMRIFWDFPCIFWHALLITNSIWFRTDYPDPLSAAKISGLVWGKIHIMSHTFFCFRKLKFLRSLYSLLYDKIFRKRISNAKEKITEIGKILLERSKEKCGGKWEINGTIHFRPLEAKQLVL